MNEENREEGATPLRVEFSNRTGNGGTVGTTRRDRHLLGIPETQPLIRQSVERAFAARVHALGLDPGTLEHEQRCKLAITAADMPARNLLIARDHLLTELPS